MCAAADVTGVIRQRLSTQRLSSAPVDDPAEAVRLLTCVQSQERDHALFSLGLRTRDARYADLLAAHSDGAFLRTHILRPTWHFVLAEDLRWILELTSARVESSMAGRHRQLGLDDDRMVGRSLDTLVEVLTGPTPLTRAEIGAEFERRGEPVAPGAPLGHLLLIGELRGLICSGPVKGVHHSYVLVDEVVPRGPSLSREEAMDRLVRRFFAGHGPASVRDFARWSSLTMTDTKRALAGIGDDLEHCEVDGETLWFDPEARARRRPHAPAAYLFPVYDEAVLTYPRLSFPVADGHPHAKRPDPFWAWVVLDEVNVGLWKRTLARDVVEVDVRLATSLGEEGRKAVRQAAERLADFVGRELSYRQGSETPPLWGSEKGHPATRRRGV
jgi:hypothetical protein